jgi:hypothetical protein
MIVAATIGGCGGDREERVIDGHVSSSVPPGR